MVGGVMYLKESFFFCAYNQPFIRKSRVQLYMLRSRFISSQAPQAGPIKLAAHVLAHGYLSFPAVCMNSAQAEWCAISTCIFLRVEIGLNVSSFMHVCVCVCVPDTPDEILCTQAFLLPVVVAFIVCVCVCTSSECMYDCASQCCALPHCGCEPAVADCTSPVL